MDCIVGDPRLVAHGDGTLDLLLDEVDAQADPRVCGRTRIQVRSDSEDEIVIVNCGQLDVFGRIRRAV